MQAQAQVSILKRATEEQSLSEYVQRLGAHSERGWALHIHLSKLGPRSRNENLVFALDMFRALAPAKPSAVGGTGRATVAWKTPKNNGSASK